MDRNRRSRAIRILTLAAVLAATLTPASVQAARATVTSQQHGVEAVLYWRRQTRSRQRLLGRTPSRSFNESCSSPSCAWHRAVVWRLRFSRLPEPPPPAPPAPPQGSSLSTPAVASDGLWACVAMAEESGSNSVAGYFGFIYPPAAYGFPQLGSSWLAVPWSVQVGVAETLLARYGSSAWGPLTREKCW